MALDVTSENFDEEVLQHNGVVIVDFWAEWCPPCRALTPLIEQLGEDNKEVVKVMKLDVDNNQDLAMKYQVVSIPTVKYFKDGEEVESIIGLQPKGVYQALIAKHIK